MEGEGDAGGPEKPAPRLVLPIEPPIDHGGERWDQIELREPRVSEVKASEEVMGATATPAAVLDAEAKLVALVGGVPDEVIAKLPTSVLNAGADYLQSFEPFGRSHRDDDPALLLELDEPVEVQKGSFTEIPLREPRVGERRKAEQHLSRGITPAAYRAMEVALVTAVSELPPAAVLKLPISAFARSAEYLTGFFERGRGTGRKSRPT
ncbi:phage tail assembly protein [Rhizosaccharibacter radicis]|uniref:Phage tail assembly protein n=1 Tax=Rhizosaccharibacter radicis TaxID=2782605 RepID=A0ABT1VW06_9PROT|nr:phage tail assembly protein [Acetobacteraceae bacterium KSS12]